MNTMRPLSLMLLIGLAACGGGGSGASTTPPVSTGGGSTTQSNYVTPSFVFQFPGGSSTSSSSRSPQFLGASSKGVVITLVSSSAGLSNVSVATNLTAAGVCMGTTTKTCTVNGPPVPPGTDVFSIVTYDTPPTGNTEPGTAKALAQTGTTATPTAGNPSYTITAGTSPTETITLYGIPGAAVETAAFTGTPGTAYAAAQNAGLSIEDAAGDPITGEFSAPVTVTDTDASGGASPAQATQINITGGTAGLTQTLNSATDASSLTVNYGGLAEPSPSINVASGGSTLLSFNVTVSKSSIVLTPTETDLFNPTAAAVGNTGTFTASEVGYTGTYGRTFTLTLPSTCTSGGTPASVYSLNATTGTSFTDTVPASPAAGICPITVGGDLQGNTATETLTYTTGGFTINGHARGK